MIKKFRHKGLERFFSTGSKAGIQTKHAARLRLQLGRLDAATSAEDMNLSGWKLHTFKGELRGYWAVWVDENWRLVFTFRRCKRYPLIIRTTIDTGAFRHGSYRCHPRIGA